MRILDKDNIEIDLQNVDYMLGELVEEKIFIKHHEKVEKVEKQSHYETITEYENGGKDVEEVIDVEGVEEAEAYDEYEEIRRYTLYPEAKVQELKIRQELLEIQQWFDATDYICLKIIRGNWLKTDTRYTDYLAEYAIKNSRANDIKLILSYTDEIEAPKALI